MPRSTQRCGARSKSSCWLDCMWVRMASGGRLVIGLRGFSSLGGAQRHADRMVGGRRSVSQTQTPGCRLPIRPQDAILPHIATGRGKNRGIRFIEILKRSARAGYAELFILLRSLSISNSNGSFPGRSQACSSDISTSYEPSPAARRRH